MRQGVYRQWFSKGGSNAERSKTLFDPSDRNSGATRITKAKFLQRQEFNAVSQVFGVECLDDQFQVAYCLADRDTEVVSIEQSCEIAPRFEPLIGNAQQGLGLD